MGHLWRALSDMPQCSSPAERLSRKGMDTIDKSAILMDAVNTWLEAVREHVLKSHNDDFRRASQSGKDYTSLSIEDSPKYIRIIAERFGGHRSIWAYVVKEDNITRTLGVQSRGDILKPASWKIPAKHARGNVFSPGENGCCNIVNWTGPSYLK